MGRAILTALAVERAHRSGERLLLSDGDGLYLRKQARDGASWTLRCRFAGREHWLTLGHYPDMPLERTVSSCCSCWRSPSIDAGRPSALCDKSCCAPTLPPLPPLRGDLLPTSPSNQRRNTTFGVTLILIHGARL